MFIAQTSFIIFFCCIYKAFAKDALRGKLTGLQDQATRCEKQKRQNASILTSSVNKENLEEKEREKNKPKKKIVKLKPKTNLKRRYYVQAAKKDILIM